MNKTKISAEIVADSINQHGDRLTSLVLTYPRIIHAEMLTHRMFSRNASSSRAVPVQKMIEAVKNNTFCPFEFQKAHKGMQGSEYFTDQDKEDCIKLWLESAELALQQAEKMKEKGITKQVINRILEPYQYYTMLITGSKEGWDNFFNLRCPQYSITVTKPEELKGHTITFKSKKEFIKFGNNQELTKDWNEIDWLQHNKGQAEIHMMALAEKIYDAVNESTPKQLKAGEWHIPFEDKIDLISWLDEVNDDGHLDGDLDEQDRLFIIDKVKISTAMAAHTSYTIVGGEAVKSYKKWIELHDKLIASEPPHSSPMEHCARAMSDEEYKVFIKGKNIGTIAPYLFSYTSKGWCNNLKGFIPYRYLIDNQMM